MKTDKDWKLTMTEETDEGFNWQPVVRIGRTVPFGYEKDPTDLDILQPVVEELELLERAKKYLKQYSYRDVANWLSEQSGRYISHVGLMKRVKLEQKRKRQASNQRYLAERYKEALQKAERLEERIGGRAEGLSTA